MTALLATGLGSVALVGGVAYVSVNYKVDNLRKQQAAEHFHTYMTAYLAEYGDWATAIRTESFDRFVRRQEGARPAAGVSGQPGGGELPSEMLERMPPRINEQARYNGPPADGPPPDLTLPAPRRASGTNAPDGGLPRPTYRDAPVDPTLPTVRRSSAPPDTPPPGLRDQRPPRDAATGPGHVPPPDGRNQRPPRDGGTGSGQVPPPEGRDQRPPRDGGYGQGMPPEGRDQRPPRDGGYGQGVPPEGRDQRPPRDGGYGQGMPPEGRDQRPPRDGGYGQGMPPEGRDQRPPRDGGTGYGQGMPPEGRDQRPQRDGGYGQGVPPEGRDQRPPRDGGTGSGHVPPHEGRDQRPPRDGGYGQGVHPEGRDQRPPRDAGTGQGMTSDGRAQRPPRDGGYGQGVPPEGRDQRPPRDGGSGQGMPPDGRAQRPPREGGYREVAAVDGRDPSPQQDPSTRRPRDIDGFELPPPARPTANEPGQRAAGGTEGGPGNGPAGERRPPRRHGDGPPPFRFVLADADYKVLLGGGQFSVGDALPEKARTSARPIVVKDKTVAYMYSDGALTPTPQEQKYIDALYNSLWWGIGAAAGLATILGVLLSRGLSRSLSGLTKAVKGMHKGELRQQVPVKGKDEVAALATAFNEMSEQLAQSHEELNASHATIMQQAEQLRELSIRDALTQLYNRRHFDEQANTLFNQAVRHKRPLTLVICDIDHFKKINDTYSHATGDIVLRHVGNILRKHMRLSDLVARYGGEEFVMAFPETPGPQAAALCDKLRTLIENYPWHEVHPDLKVTMSMGVFADIGAGSAETMLQKADALLYRAKETGRNRVVFA